jgi:hypothetical protein
MKPSAAASAAAPPVLTRAAIDRRALRRMACVVALAVLAMASLGTRVLARRAASHIFARSRLRLEAAAVPPSPDAPLRTFVSLSIVEGFGAWSDSVLETIEAAIALNRTWVEPCVRNGCLEPCRCGAVERVAPWSVAAGAAATARGEDPLLLPFLPDWCKVDMPPLSYSRPPDYVARAYPLSAYVDVDALRARYGARHFISYERWCAARVRGAAPATLDAPSGGRVLLPPSTPLYNFDWDPAWVNETAERTVVGDFIFSAQRARLADKHDTLARMAADPSDEIFIYLYIRGSLPGGVHPMRTVPLNPWHELAVRNFVAERGGGRPYAAFHWRSEQVQTSLIEGCARNLSAAAAGGLPVYFPPASGSGGAAPFALLVADMPSPRNPQRMWDDYKEGDDEPRRAAVAHLLGAGFVKYDDAVFADAATAARGVDAGVLALRDFLFATHAELYVTCQGDHVKDCRECFRAGSNFVQRITRDRQFAARPVTFDWLRLNEGLHLELNRGAPPPGPLHWQPRMRNETEEG